MKKFSQKHIDGSVEATIGERVRTARMMSSLSQEKLGESLGITFQQVQKYEKGTNRVAASTLCKIAKATGQPIAFFLPDDATKAVADHSHDFNRMDFEIAKMAGALPLEQKRAVKKVIAALTPEA